MTPGGEARRLLRSKSYGMLATLSKRFSGHPFGSVTPFVLDHEAYPLILISTLAEHTRNLDHDHRLSLLVHETGENVQAEARVTLIGHAERMADQEAPKARYVRYFPDATVYFDTHDFFFYRITPTRLRYIGGFGEIHWIASEGYFPPDNALAQHEEGILRHMNEDHGSNLRDYCRFYRGRKVFDVQMIGIDCDGFDLRGDAERMRFDFDSPVRSPQEARTALVKMAQAAKP
jgi:heme iron utilization protein